MTKHLKIFSIAIVLTFSFLFIGNVKAISWQGFTLDDNFFNRAWSEFLESNTKHQVDYPYVSCRTTIGSNTMDCYFFKDYSYNSSTSSSIKINAIPDIASVAQFEYNKSTDVFSSNNANNFYLSKNTASGTGAARSISNFDVYNGTTKVYSKSFDYNPSQYFNVDFHLNGGTVMDFSQPLNPNYIELDYQITTNTQELEDYLEDIIITRGNAEFLGWYYDANFATPYIPGDTLSSDIDLYAKWETPKTFNFHLNGGYVYDPSDGWGSEEDFSISLYNSEIEDFFTNLEVKKASMLFDGIYYDTNYINVFSPFDNFTNNSYDLYIKWRYEKVDDFLENTIFNTYTFNLDYQYAIINRGNNGGNIYLGLPFSSFSLEVYEYNEQIYKVKEGPSVCLVPIYKKNGYSVYDVNTIYTNNQEVLILPRALFYELNPSDFENPSDVYNFYLTNNAYVSYTNDLSNTDIVDSNGEHISINLQNSYELSRQYQDEYNNKDNIFYRLKYFLNKLNYINSIWNNLFNTFYNHLPDIVQAFLIFVFNILLILITVVLVGWK